MTMSPTLPIDPLQEAFCSHLRSASRQHLIVEAETGSGKSTRLPLWAKTTGRVLVIEPRRIACTSLAEYLSGCQQTPLGEDIGYAIHLKHHYTQNSQIIFVTPGVALRWLSDDGLVGFETIIIDEFHERRWDTDLLLALLKQQNRHQLVITSATIDGNRLASYLDATRLHSEGRCFDVSVHHQAADSRHMPDIRGLEKRVVDAIRLFDVDNSGDILVFLPGRREILACQQALNSAIPVTDAQVIPLHASVEKSTQQKALTTSHQRRIVLATNVAETSLTIPGITLVIDSGLERRSHQRNGRTVLGLHSISRASSEQRRGRAGRLSEGRCVRLWGQHAPLEALTPPELLREELTEPMLAAACSGEIFADLDFVDPLPEKTLLQARDKLRQMKALDNQGRATAQGKVLFGLPLDSQFAHLITAMPDTASRCAMVDLACALSQPQRLIQLPAQEEARRALVQWQPQPCDVLTLISAVRRTPPKELSPDHHQLRECRQMASHIRAALALPPLPPITDETSPGMEIDRLSWLNAVIRALPELVFVRREKRREALGNGFSELTVGRDSRFGDDAQAAVVFDQFNLPGKGSRQTLSLGTCMAPIPLSSLKTLGLTQQQLGDVTLHKSPSAPPAVMVNIRHHYAGRLIEQEYQPPAPQQLTGALARLILANRLLKSVGQQLVEDIGAWRLYVALGLDKDDMATVAAPRLSDPLTWLTDRLTCLGIEQLDDLELLGPEDLSFDGIPEWQREEFNSRYPRTLSLGDLFLTADYQVGKKLVIIEKTGGLRKTDPKRWELPQWNGWRIRYKIASRLVDIR